MLLPLTYSTLRLFLDGMILMMALFSFATFIWHRKRVYAWYGLYLVGMTANFHLNDLAHQLPVQHASVSEVAMVNWLEFSAQTLAFLCHIRFTTTLLNLPKRDPYSVKLINGMMALLLSGQLMDTLYIWFDSGNTHPDPQELVRNFNRCGLTLLVLLLVWRIMRLRDVVASLFVVGTGIFTAGFMLTATLNFFDWLDRIPARPFTFPMIPLQLSIVIESLLFALAISFLNRQTERQKIRYQAGLIDQLRENERKQARLNGLRDEIARNLHDEIGSQLSSITVLSQATAYFVTDSRAQQRLSLIGQTARQVMGSMREIIWSLNPSSDSLQDVGVRIHETAHRLFGDSAIRVRVQLPEAAQLPSLTEKQKREVCLITNECLTNILRHAHATQVGIDLNVNTHGLTLTICDDGIGFDTHTEGSGLGLTSMKQRAERLNARLVIQSACGEGTTLTLLCPLETVSMMNELLLSEDCGFGVVEPLHHNSYEHVLD